MALVVHVETKQAGDVLIEDHAASDTTLFVSSVSDFAADGGQLSIDGQPYDYLSTNADFNTIELDPATPLLSAYLGEDSVEVKALPAREVKRALFIRDEGEDGEWALVPNHLWDRMPDGIRDPEEQEEVELVYNESTAEWEIRNILDEAPVVDGSYIDPETLPDIPEPVEPPAASPLLTITGMPNTFVIRAEQVDPGVEIEYHISEVVEGETEAFEPSPDTLSTTTTATVYVPQGMPDGGPFFPDRIYAFRAIATNSVGAADPSPAVTGELDLEAVKSVVAEEVITGFLLTGTIRVGNITIDADKGITIPTEGAEATVLAADGSGSTFTGQGTFDALDVLGNLNIRGLTNFIQGLLTLATGVPNPGQQPLISTQYDAVSTPEGDDGGFYRKGLVETDSEWGWVEAPTWAEYSHMQFITKSAGDWAFRNFDSLVGWQAIGGATKVGTRYFLLSRQKSNPSNWRILVHAADGEAGRTHGEYIGSLESNGAGLGSISPAAYPTIGKDASGNLLVAWVTASGNAYVRKMAAIGGAAVSLTNLGMSWSTSSHMFGVQQVGSRYFVASSGSIYAFNVSGGARTTADEFPSANTLLAGIWHDGTVWHTFNFGFIVYHYTNNSGTYDFAYTWYDSDPGGSGTAESLRSPIKTMAPKKFAQWRIAIPAMPPDDGTTDGANTARLYAAPTGNPLIIQGQLPEGTTAIIYESFNTSGANPPLVSGFSTRLSTALGRIESAASDGLGALIKFLGTGEWRLGGLSGDDEGNVSGVAAITHPGDVPWTNITAEAGYAHVSGDPGQYCVYNRQVFFRGRLRRTSTTNTFVGNIGNTAARPLVQINGMIRCGNDWIPWVIGTSGNLIISSAVTTGQDIHVASAAGVPYLTVP